MGSGAGDSRGSDGHGDVVGERTAVHPELTKHRANSPRCTLAEGGDPRSGWQGSSLAGPVGGLFVDAIVELESDSPHVYQQAGMGGVEFYPGSNAADVDVEGSGGIDEVGSPGSVEEGLAWQ